MPRFVREREKVRRERDIYIYRKRERVPAFILKPSQPNYIVYYSIRVCMPRFVRKREKERYKERKFNKMRQRRTRNRCSLIPQEF